MTTMFGAVIVAGLLAWSPTVLAQEQPSPAARPELAPMALEAGVWEADITFPAREAGKPEGKAKGVQTNTLHSGGRWLLNQFMVEGTPYEGTGMWGWDAASGGYRGIWGDNNEHRIRQDVGTWDAASATMTWTSKMVESTGKEYPLRFTEVFAGDKRTFDMVAITPSGKAVGLVSMVFIRRKT